MAVSINAAEAAVRCHHHGTTGAGEARDRGTFRSRQVSQDPAGAWAPSLRECMLRQEVAADDPVHPRPESSAAARLVSEVERDVLEACTLLERFRPDVLSDDGWHAFFSALESARTNQARFEQRLGRLAATGPADAGADCSMRTLRRRVDNAHGRLISLCEASKPVIRQVRVIVPGSNREPVVVNSRRVPGIPPGIGFLHGVPTDDAGPHPAAGYTHVPDLEQTVLTGPGGQTLFKGLRHSLPKACDLDGNLLAGLQGDAARSLLKTLYIPYYCSWLAQHFGSAWPAQSEAECERQIDALAAQIQSQPAFATFSALAMRELACGHVAKQVVAMALVADPDKFRRARDGETVDLKLSVISLMTLDDSHSWEPQHKAFRALKGCRNLYVKTPEGTLVTVNARIGYRNFSILTNPDEGPYPSTRYDGFASLLGETNTMRLGGAAIAKIEAMRAGASSVRDRPGLDGLALRYRQTVQKLGADHPDASSTGKNLSDLKAKMHRLEKKSRTLEVAGQQLKDLWTERGGVPADRESPMHAAARLALVVHLMGETPVLYCAGEEDPTERLDAEIKFLAAVAHSRHGQLPALGPETDAWAQARTDFRLQLAPH